MIYDIFLIILNTMYNTYLKKVENKLIFGAKIQNFILDFGSLWFVRNDRSGKSWRILLVRMQEAFGAEEW